MKYCEGINDMVSYKCLSLRWFNDACYELKLPNGKVILIDPYIDDSKYKKLSSSDVTGADYILISHVHFDHVLNVGDLSEKFNSKIFVGRNSALELAKKYNLPGYRVYPCASGDIFHTEDFKLEILYGKHTNIGDIDRPNNWPNSVKELNLDEDSVAVNMCGSYEYINFLITLKNNIKILIVGGEASIDTIERVKGLYPNVSIVQIPRESAEQISDLYASVGGQVIFPHHHETILELEGGVENIEKMLDLVKIKAPYTNVICPEKGKWYDISLSVVQEK